MPSGFEPAIPGHERPQTHAFERAVNGIVDLYFAVPNYTAITNNESQNNRTKRGEKNTFLSADKGTKILISVHNRA
jgi:hypothetical protein